MINVLRIQLERQDIKYFPSIREYSANYGITQKIMDEFGDKKIILHPGPVNRGVEIESEVIDGPHSVVLQQVENGVAVRMAVLYLLALNK
jgi:aspartate carbamoyltransferase catalytic subunit